MAHLNDRTGASRRTLKPTYVAFVLWPVTICATFVAARLARMLARTLL